ncbi:hypothetical protein G9A89_009888 [Geosiphon pyriformis]|nr:hypothetical protein G9A89_009888 [Geosiphon pyriformis]
MTFIKPTYHTLILALFTLASFHLLIVNAHFRFETPTRRGPSVANASIAPCGGYDVVNETSKSDFPIVGNVNVSFGDGNGTISFYFAPNSNGTFVSVNNATVDVQVEEDPTHTKRTPYITQVDLKKANATVGQNGVLQGVYKSREGNTTWYQCADIKVIKANTTSTSTTNNSSSSSDNKSGNSNTSFALKKFFVEFALLLVPVVTIVLGLL